MDSRIVEVAIGLTFVFAALAGAVSLITTGISSLLQLRSEFLLRGLRSLLDGDHKAPRAEVTNRLLRTGLFATQGRTVPDPSGARSRRDEALDVSATAPHGMTRAQTSRAALHALPAYFSSRTFARSLVTMLADDAPGGPTIDRVRTSIEKLSDSPLRTSLMTCLNVAEGRIDRFHAAVEQWYDDHMERVSGWYKRYLTRISFVVGLLLVAALNANAIRLAQTLWTDDIVLDTIVGQAIAAAGAEGSCPQAVAARPGADAGAGQDVTQLPAADFRDCLAYLRTDLAEAAGAGLPLLWRTSPLCVAGETLKATDPLPDGSATVEGSDLVSELGACSVWERLELTDPVNDDAGSDVRWLLFIIAGWVLSAFALVPGGRWWYDMLKQLGTLRGSGPPPPRGPSEPPPPAPANQN
jgi:hypothetical protein